MFTGISLFLLIVALVFIILATVTAPVTTTLNLAAADNIIYGIFGYCDGSICQKVAYPVKFGDIKTSTTDWAMSRDIRNTLSSGFIVAPIAAGLTFLTVILTAATLFVENSIIKILSLVFGVISFLAAAVICVFVVLVFHPHVAWAGWLLVAAAGLLLVAVPCLILSVGVADSNDDQDSVATEEKHLANYTKITESSFSSEPKHHYFGTTVAPKGSSTDDMSDIVRDYTYRGTVKPEFTSADNALGSYVSKPNGRGANESLGTSKSSVYQDSLVNFSQIPSKPISANQSVAPNFQSSSAVPGNIKPIVPYPPSERGSVLNAANYGVFDHHPSVEGHKPFTELDDDDENDRNSMLPGQRELDSDDDSDFTSVSQRPPNVMYNAQHPQQQQQQPFRGQPGQYQPQQQQPHPQQQQPYQQQYPNVSQYQPSFQQGQPPSPQNAFYGNGASLATQQQSQQRPPQQFNQQYSYGPGAGSRSSPRGPTISDSVLNTNPDFAVGPASRRRPGRPQQGQPQGGAFPNRPARRAGPSYGTRDPYSAF